MKLALLLPLLLVACSELPEIEEGTCGNFVIDRGEDCDSSAEDCDECRLTCIANGGTVANACSVDGYVCGVDGFCHAPSGTFGISTGSFAVNASTFDVTDIDKDGFGDVVALSGTSVEVNHGDRDGALIKRSSTLTPYVRGPAAYLELDGDASRDIVVPTADGLVAFSSAYGVVAPHPFSIDLSTGDTCDIGKPFHAFALDDKFMGVVFADTNETDQYTFQIGIAILDVEAGNACPIATPTILCTSAGEPNPFQIDEYETTVDPLLPSHVVAVVTDRIPQSPVPLGGLCAARIRKTGDRAFAVDRLTPSSVYAVQGRPILADLDDTGCPSLIQSEPVGMQLVELKGKGTGGTTCAFEPIATGIALPMELANQALVGRATLSPRVGALGKDALVMSRGVYAVDIVNRAIAMALYVSDRPLLAATEGDLDADGDVDIVALGAQADDVDVLYRAPKADTFLRFRIDTGGVVSSAMVGDFDGNQVDDIVFAEAAQLGERLKVAYGTRDRVLDPVEAGAFSSIVGMIKVQAPDSTDPQQLVDDLVILDHLGDKSDPLTLGILPVYTLFHGSPQRTLLSFFDPRPPSNTDNFQEDSSSFVAVAARNGVSRPDGRVTDVLAIEVGSSSAKLWSLVNAGREGFLQSTPTVGQLDECLANASDETTFCTVGARYLRWPLADRDVVIGVNAATSFRATLIDPTRPAMASQPVAALDDPRGLGVRSLHAIDLDGDGTLELVASFGLRLARDPDMKQDDGTFGYTLVCEVDSSGRPQSCTDIVELVPELTGWACVDSAPGALTPRGRGDQPLGTGTALALLCHRPDETYGKTGQLFRIEHVDGYTATPAWTRSDAGYIERIKLADVTGDGVEDLLATLIMPSERSEVVLVIPQCASSDVACIDGLRTAALPVDGESP